MPNLLIDLVVDRVDLVDEGANTAAFIKLYKRKERDAEMDYSEIIEKLKPEHAEIINEVIEKAKAEVPKEVEEELEETKKALTLATDELALVKEKVEKSKDPVEDNLEEVVKSLDPSVQKIFKSLQSQKAAAEAVAKQLSDQKEEEDAIAKAKTLKAIPVDEEKLVEVVKGVSDEVFEILKSAAAVLEDSVLFDEVGKGIGGKVAANTWDKIEKMAATLVEEEGITLEKAVDKVITSNPELYKEYLKGGAN